MKNIFGPILSRRFGKSLGIDLSSNFKQCNFDCVYCELKKSKPIDTQTSVISYEEIFQELSDYLLREPDIDVITITANGEPTLYPYLKELMQKIDIVKDKVRTLILSNGSTITSKQTQEVLHKFDIVKLSLDAVDAKVFKRIDRPHKELNLEAMIQAMQEFRNSFEGEFILEVLFVKGINDKPEHIQQLNNVIKTLKPQQIDLGTIDRPPAYDVQALSFEELEAIAKQFDPSLPIKLPRRKQESERKQHYSKEDILNTLDKRPLTNEDIEQLFDTKSKSTLYTLVKEGIVFEKIEKNNTFFILKP